MWFNGDLKKRKKSEAYVEKGGKIERGQALEVEEQFTLRALVWYLTAFLVCSLATVTWSTDLDTFCSMLLTMSPWKKQATAVTHSASPLTPPTY